MGRLVKTLVVLLAGIVGIVVIAAVSLALFFDPNDFRDRISAGVREATGRELVIAGDIDLKLFPWLAVEIGQTSLGNAEGFEAERFLAFERASLSVRILPLIFSQRLEVGTATLDGLAVNLEVAADGSNNWEDLAEADSAETETTDAAASGEPLSLDVGNIRIGGANVSYADGATGTTYRLSDFEFESSRIASNVPINLTAAFSFASVPEGPGGQVAMRGTATMTEGAAQVVVDGFNVNGVLEGIVSRPAEFNFDSRSFTIDTEQQTMSPGEMDLTAIGLAIAADVEPFSYAGTPEPVAEVRVAPFSLKELMETLDIPPPVTADPAAMSQVSFSARAAIGQTAIALTSLTLELDESAMTGTLSIPTTSTGALRFDLEVDQVRLDGYMAPADAGAAATDDEASDVEIPADLIRTLNVDGSFRIRNASLGGMDFENMELGVNASGGRLRLNPLAADFYEGSYAGDVRIDASGDLPSVSANERVTGVNVGAMIAALYDVDNVTGTLTGGFQVGGRGQNLSAIREDLDGSMSIELTDGAWEGTDVWYQLRRARAMFRQETPPEPTLPARTEFSAITATGTITDGVFSNDDFLAELPFLQLRGKGLVDLGTNEVDYGLEVRVLERPEFMAEATPEEVDDFTSTVVPLRITGPMSAPSVRPDMEGIFRARVEEAIEEKKDELRDQLLNRLLGGDEPAEGEIPPDEETEEDPEEQLKKDLLKKLFDN